MAENPPRSKLKRVKAPQKDQQQVFSCGLKGGPAPLFSWGGRSADPAAGWWSDEQLPAVESLWASTLKSSLPYLENQHWDLVPDLPQPAPVGPAALQSDEPHWFDLSEEVAPFPEPSPHPPRTLSPDPLRLSEQTKPGPEQPAGPLPSHSGQRRDGSTPSFQTRTNRPRPSLHTWEGPASSAGPSGFREYKEESKKQEEETLSRVMTVSLQGEEEEEVQRNMGGDGGAAGGGGGLQSCPMCLLVFPVGSTQLQCDGHLAHCLSEVNMDVTW